MDGMGSKDRARETDTCATDCFVAGASGLLLPLSWVVTVVAIARLEQLKEIGKFEFGFGFGFNQEKTTIHCDTGFSFFFIRKETWIGKSQLIIKNESLQ